MKTFLINLLTSWNCKKSTFINVISKAKRIVKEEMNKPKHFKRHKRLMVKINPLKNHF